MEGLSVHIMRESHHSIVKGKKMTDALYRSSKSALHGLVHWLASAYAKSGVTVNGVAPALIQDTTILPGNNEELAKSRSFF
jgi:NAD(P)-dependent dehydrogenase (short-subunit alcohol dehydrogenase family)